MTVASGTAAGESFTPSGEEVAGAKARLERILTENLIPFWLEKGIDAENGGYRINHDAEGEFAGPHAKGIISQSRALYFFARLARSPYGKPKHLEAARQGFEFLRDRMWDPEYGGFYWEVSYEGDEALKPNKHPFGQCYALYGLAEYMLASEDAEARNLALATFELVERHCRDRVNGGYFENFARDWSPLPDNEVGYLGVAGRTKTLNTHQHLLEAYAPYYRATISPAVREALAELIVISSVAEVNLEVGTVVHAFEPDWTFVPKGGEFRSVYGADVENVWLVIEACDAIHQPNAPLLGMHEYIFENTFRYGWDEEKGGLYQSGPLGEEADNRVKEWWPQTEMLIGSLHMYRLTGEKKYWEGFAKTLDWIEANHVDWEHGEWWASVEDGERSGAKAHGWKTPYHSGRCVIEGLALLSAME